MTQATLAQLRAFLAVARGGSFSSAAAEVGRSQSSLSESLRALEKALGHTLLKRSASGVTLTSAGEQALHYAQRSVQAADDLTLALKADPLDGTLRLAACRSVGTYVLPAVLAEFQRRHSAVNVQVRVVESETEAAALLHSAQADATLVSLPVAGPLLHWPLLQDPYVVLAPTGRGKHAFCLSEFGSANLLLPPNLDSCAELIFAYLRRHNVQARSVRHLQADSVIMGMVQHGLGLTVMPALAAQPLMSGVQLLSLPKPLERTIGLSVLAQRASLPLLRRFAQTARDTTQRIFTLPDGQLHPAV